MRQILRKICVYLVINNLKNRAEHVLGRWIIIFLLYFTENALLKLTFKIPLKIPLFPKGQKIPQFVFLGEKSPKLATLHSLFLLQGRIYIRRLVEQV
jgi:hypothetical protein